ncbi:MAG: GNAT family N-acetyltransferase, partial [Maribacter sp.]
ESNDKNYTKNLIRNRIKNGLILFSLRNFLSRTGIDIAPYFWVLEGSKEYEVPKIKGSISDYELAYLNIQDLEAIGEYKTRLTMSELIKGLEDGQKCIALKNNEKIAAFMFIQYENFIFSGRSFLLNNKDAYLLNMYTFDNYRGKNLAPYLRHKSYEILKEKGKENIYSITDYFNKSSIRFKEKLEARNTVLYLRITLFKKVFWNFKLKKYKS